MRDFPSHFTHLAILDALFVQDRVCVVDVNEDAAAATGAGKLLKQAVCARKREMTDRAGSLAGSCCADEFVIAPECAILKHQVAGLGQLFPFVILARKRRRKEQTLASMFDK